jgi:hypothetical protein
MKNSKSINRRQFIGSAAAASVAFTVVPRYVLGGKGHIAPSDKLTLAYIGCGTQGIREMAELLKEQSIQIVSVCDPNKMSTNYVDWSKNEIRDIMRKTIGEPGWGENLKGIPGGRDMGQEMVNKYYSKEKGSTFSGCSSYADFRELLEKEKDINAVKIMTPDHLHATVAIAALRKGKHVVTHKPIANRMHEVKVLLDVAKKSGRSSHLLAWSKRPAYDVIKKMIADGKIGTLKEIHNWSNRPMWPQWQTNPTDTPAVPDGLDWNLWLGPVPDRPYHPNYTNAVFRGWYDFGSGSIADMGHYSLFPLFLTLGINSPALSAEACGTTTCALNESNVSVGVRNDVAFPLSCTVRFKFGPQPELPAFDLFWYDGGMRPTVPEEMYRLDKSFTPEGMMFVGDKGRIVANFRGENPVLYADGKEVKIDVGDDKTERGNQVWIDAFKNNVQAPGSFLYAGPVTETILLGAVALRARKRVMYDTAAMKITNNEDANRFLTREYRKGWEL